MIVKGQKVNDRYEIIKTIGEGGMANVYLAYDEILDRNVAIKVLRGDLSTDEKFVRRFQREALSASSLSHPNIVEIYDVGEDDGDYYIVMEYVPGKNLKQLLKKRGKLTTSEVVDIMLQITSAMSVAHDSLIIHRDLKPQNILIMDDGGVKITDFGIAMALNATQLTQTNSAMGSVHYFPPEQANGKGATLKSDVYSLGIMMYELLTGVLPFRGDNAVEIALKHLKEPIPSIKVELPELPQSLENIILIATAKNAKNRYANAKEMHDDLLTCLNRERVNEPKVKLKYPEGILEDQEVVTTDANLDTSLVSQIKDADDKKSNKRIIILSAIFGVLALVLLFVFLILPKLTEVPEVLIPDVSDLSVADAERKLEKLGLEVADETKEKPSDKIDEGKIVETEPAIGRTVKEGTRVTLVISSGVKKYKIENFVGKNYIEIKTKLEMYDIEVVIEKKDVKDEIEDPQLILEQSVSAGTELKAGDKITLYIPNDQEKYPDIVGEGWTVDEAKEWATKHEVKLQIEYKETNDKPNGTILSQSRGTSSVVVSGATLKITVAKERVDTGSTTTPEDNGSTSSEGAR